MAPPNELNIPELRMIGTGPDRTWQWKFNDNQWRDMMQTIDSSMKIDKSKQVTKMPGWVPFVGGMTLKKGPVVDVSGGGIFGGQSPLNKALEELFPELGDQYIQSVVDFDILADKTNLLPSGFKANTSPEYLMAVAELWREVTGYNPTDGGQVAYYNPDQTYKTNVDGDSELFKIASDLVEDMGWRDVATARNYELDWGDPGAIADFMNSAQEDFDRGIKYDDAESLANGQNPASNIDIIIEPEELAAKSGLKRKVVGEFGEGAGNKRIADSFAANIPNSKVEEIDGQWAITVPPGAGGFTSIDAGNAFIRDSGLDATKWEMAPSGEGDFLIREKRPEDTQGSKTVTEARAALVATGADPSQYEFRAGEDGKIYPVYTGKQPGGQFDTKDEAESWLRRTGNIQDDEGNLLTPEGYEVVLGPEGKWIVREKLRYADAGQPGAMFEPTITEDPTGRQFGLTAGGDVKDFGYGMAGDITQEELAGYQVPERSLPMIVAKAIEQGNWELARGVQAFIDSPSERDLLDYAAQYAEAPADLAVLSAIARGETMVQPGVGLPEGMGAGMGQATRIGAPGEVYTAAYKSFVDSMNQGYVPNEDELRDLFDPKNDPAYIATQELANKYETEIGNLRNELAAVNAKATERIENTQTSTMNLMTGLFENTISSFQDLMKSQNDASASQIAEWGKLYEGMKGDRDDVYTRQTGRGAEETSSTTNTTVSYWDKNLGQMVEKTGTPEYHQSLLNSGAFLASKPTGDKPAATSENDTGKWFFSNKTNTWTQYEGTGKFTAEGFLREGDPGAPDRTDKSLYDENGVLISSYAADGADDAMVESMMSPGKDIPADLAADYQMYGMTRGGEGTTVAPELQAQFADIVTNVPGEKATESQFVAQRGGRDWGGKEEREKPLEQQSWQAQYFAPQVKAEQKAFERGEVDPYEFEGAEGGVVQGPTMALLGEKEPEFIVPFSKVDEFKQGFLPMGRPRQTRRGSTVANFEDSIPRFANGGVVTGPRFGGVTAGELTPYGETGAFVTPGTRAELELGAEGQYGANGISRAPRIGATDFQSLLKQYTQPPTEQEAFFQEFGGTTPRAANLANIPEYELRQRLGASEFAGTNPAQHPIGIQQLMAGRPIARPRSLMTAANMPKPSGQALRNMLPSETAYYQKMGRMAGIPQEELEREMRSVMPGGNRRTPLRMGARRVRQA